AGADRLDGPARERLSRGLVRGNVQAQLSNRSGRDGTKIVVDHGLLDELIALHEAYAGRVDPGLPRLDRLLAVRGVVEHGEEGELDESARATWDAAVLSGLEAAVADLVRARGEEGGRLASVLVELLDEVDALVARAAATAEAQPAALSVRLNERVGELNLADVALPEERLAQEIALLVAKADVREELDRLRAHGAAARALLDEGGAVGRRFDFLCQEFNREANTICSKAATLDLTNIGLELKTAIDRLREQIQNIE
ncbi:MAG: DUF1732 domain-containing protein, partial [Rhodospirillaceae bacterium]|nr:DUF1732 domain-containing protein [Rhodospirillaceae bacterium]